MPNSQNSEFVNNLKFFSKVASTIVIFEGSLGIISFITNLNTANRTFNAFIHLDITTSICLLTCGISLLLLQNENKKILGPILGLVVAFSGLTNQVVYFLNKAKDPLIFEYLMEPKVALFFLIVGLTLFLIDFKTKNGHRPGELLNIVAVFICLLPYIGYAYGAPSLLLIQIDTNISIVFALLCAGIFSSRPSEGIMSLVTSTYTGGFMLRRLIFAFIGISILLGILRFIAQQAGMFGIQFGMFYIIAFCITLLVLLILKTTGSLDLADSKRNQAEQEIQRLYKDLEKMVIERTKQLDETNKRLRIAMKALEHRAEELLKSKKEAEQFAYIASHDLQQPLGLVTGYAKLLEKKYKDKFDQNANDYILTIVESTDKMKKLITDLLKYSRLGTQTKTLKLINCSKVIEELKKELLTINGNNDKIITYEKLPSVVIEESQLRQVFQNLIGNALKFHSKDPPHIHINATKNGNEWVFSVKDNGIGIDPVFSERIFGMFQRLHNELEYPGSGIGLAICKKIIESFSGRIWVESELGKGSTFYFTIPVIE